MSVAEAFAGASGGILGSLTSIFTRNSNNKAIARENAAQRQFAHDEAALAHDRQLEIMDKQNEWNSFGNQRKLAEEAGFNPNMLFGQGGAAGIATSSGASGGAQANTPSVGYPDSVVDPSVVGALSDAALKAAQVKNINADTHKKESETAGQSLQNTFQQMSNAIFEKYGEKDFVLGMDLKDAQRAAKDAERSLSNMQWQLNLDELYNMRPKQAGEIVANTLLSQANEFESKMRAAKTQTEREYIAKNYLLQARLVASTIALNASKRRESDTNATNWSKGGVLHENMRYQNNSLSMDNAMKSVQNNYRLQLYDFTMDQFIGSLKSQYKYMGTSSEWFNRIFTEDSGWFRTLLMTRGVMPQVVSPVSPFSF